MCDAQENALFFMGDNISLLSWLFITYNLKALFITWSVLCLLNESVGLMF